MSFSKIGKDFTLKALISVRNPTKSQLVHFTNVFWVSRDTLVQHKLMIDNIYESEDFLQNLHAIKLLSIYDMSDEMLETIKKPYPYKFPPSQ
jgi:hypothetical protein